MDSKIPNARWFRVIVPIMIACIISFMDRVNISFALPGGMESDLAITSQMAGLAGGIFFIGYLFLQVLVVVLLFMAAAENSLLIHWRFGPSSQS